MNSDSNDPNYLYSLHPGDIIEYYDWHTMHCSPKIVRATVISIDDSCFKNENFTVTTSMYLSHPLDIQHNDRFRIVSSIHKDAPLSGQWTSLKEVNLVKGKYSVLGARHIKKTSCRHIRWQRHRSYCCTWLCKH